MPLSRTIAKLKSVPKRVIGLAAAVAPGTDRLSDLKLLHENPGQLNGRYYVPDRLAEGAPLVVVLHGCTQSAAAYDHGSGWSRLADRHGFALLLPEQVRANNPNLCFNWFQPQDTTRGHGEAASIRGMIDVMRTDYAIDPRRIFVTGLSAGGAMASAMLASYPETFAAGAVIAGIPYGCASGVNEAFEAMSGRSTRAGAAELGVKVRAASAHRGPWPRVSVWHGSADATVAPDNADAIVRQWTDVHGLSEKPSRSDVVDGYPRRVWTGADGQPVIERFEITGLGHGTPLRPGTAPGEAGEARAHMLDAGISSTDHIAAFFGIGPAVAASRTAPAAAPRPKAARTAGARAHAPSGPQKIIEDALRAAGLMR